MKRFLVKFLSLGLAALSSTAFSADKAVRMSIYEYASRIAVKVNSETAEIFTANRNGGHGSGYFIGTRKDKSGKEIGIVFTNRHVIESSFDHIQRIRIDLPTNSDRPETLDTKLVYVSNIYDFAVLEFEIDQMKRSKDVLTPAILPTKADPVYYFSKNHSRLKGTNVLAQGNPLDSTDIATPGVISGRWRDVFNGDFIQTTAAINPGNSGGPLIDMQTGMVVGMNTLKIADADTTGFAIPIGELLDDYQEWLKDPSYANQKVSTIRFGTNPEGELEVLGVAKVIRKKYPKFFEEVNGLVLRVVDAPEQSQMRPGDQIVKVNGQFQQASIFELRKVIQRSNKTLKVELVRNGKLITLDMPFDDETYLSRRQRVDFVNLSGMIFRGISGRQRWWSDHSLKSRVLIYEFLNSTEANFGASRRPSVQSILVGVQIDFIDYEIQTLNDLKIVLKNHPNAKFIRLDVREPLLMRTSDNGFTVVRDMFGISKYNSVLSTYVVPITEVVTPRQFSIHKFSEGFKWDQGDFATRDWKNFVKERPCDATLSKPEVEDKAG